MWWSAVLGEMTSASAISLVVMPRASRRSTSTSRAVDPDHPLLTAAHPVTGGLKDGAGGVAVLAALPRLRAKPGPRLGRVESVPVRSRLWLGVIRVRCGEHPAGRGERRLPGATGIARAVEPLMVLARGRAVLGQTGGRGKHPLGQVRVQPYHFELRR